MYVSHNMLICTADAHVFVTHWSHKMYRPRYDRLLVKQYSTSEIELNRLHIHNESI